MKNISRPEVKAKFLSYLENNNLLGQKSYCYLSNHPLMRSDLAEKRNQGIDLQDVYGLEQMENLLFHHSSFFKFPAWIGAIYTGQKYKLYHISLEGYVNYLMTFSSLEIFDTLLAPISGFLLPDVSFPEDLGEQTRPSIRAPIIVPEPIVEKKKDWKFYLDTFRPYIEFVFVSFWSLLLTVLTAQYWYHWIVAIGVILAFLSLQINFENQKLNPQNALWNYFCLYSKEACWIIFFIATQSYSGLLSPVLTMAYPIYRGLFDKLIK